MLVSVGEHSQKQIKQLMIKRSYGGAAHALVFEAHGVGHRGTWFTHIQGHMVHTQGHMVHTHTGAHEWVTILGSLSTCLGHMSGSSEGH